MLRRVVRTVGVGILGLAVGFAGAAAALFVWLECGPDVRVGPDLRDITQLVSIPVDVVVRPRTVSEVAALLQRAEGPVSFAGRRASMGGQIGTDGALVLDMRGLDQVEAVDPTGRTARVQAGASWRQLIDVLDPHDLSVAAMQSYANFTVGGSLSVNAHGRYVNQGAVSRSVRSIDLVLADGAMVSASRQEHPDLFWSALGGYGAMGAIVRAELDLAQNRRLARTSRSMRFDEFPAWFDENVRGSGRAVLFNADLYPPQYDRLVAITFTETDAAPTAPERLQRGGPAGTLERLATWWVADGPLGKWARERYIDPARLAPPLVVSRNWEATYDIASLEPRSRSEETAVLQEYFIPVDRIASFVPEMARIFQAHKVDVLNVSIRHAVAEPEPLLTWSPTEVFAFVIYYEQGTTDCAQNAVADWTREMADAVLAAGGRWYLPYQPHATTDQLRRAYPRWDEWLAAKRRFDPRGKLRNQLLDAYAPAPLAEAGAMAFAARLDARPTWRRPPDQTWLTLPEWQIVYAADEAAALLREGRAAEVPWFGDIGRFWSAYRSVWSISRASERFNLGYHAMIWVIGVSFTAESVLRGTWEGTIGRLTSGGPMPAEEQFLADVAGEYGAFLHHTPWFRFPFAARREALSQIPTDGTWRGWERRWLGRIELTLKSWWGAALGAGSAAAYGTETDRIEAWIRPGDARIDDVRGLTIVEADAHGNVLVTLPRYEPFTSAAIQLAARDIEIVSVAGGHRILAQLDAPADVPTVDLAGELVYQWDRPSRPDRRRVAVAVPLRRLDELAAAWTARGARIERLYDF